MIYLQNNSSARRVLTHHLGGTIVLRNHDITYTETLKHRQHGLNLTNML